MLKDFPQMHNLVIADTVPYPTLCTNSRVEAELTKLEENGVIEAVANSDWAAPIIPVVKDHSNSWRL